jgi:hypothetical protein
MHRELNRSLKAARSEIVAREQTFAAGGKLPAMKRGEFKHATEKSRRQDGCISLRPARP